MEEEGGAKQAPSSQTQGVPQVNSSSSAWIFLQGQCVPHPARRAVIPGTAFPWDHGAVESSAPEAMPLWQSFFPAQEM